MRNVRTFLGSATLRLIMFGVIRRDRILAAPANEDINGIPDKYFRYLQMGPGVVFMVKEFLKDQPDKVALVTSKVVGLPVIRPPEFVV